MKCPFCTNLENKVIDSRLSKDGQVIRRRRECLGCGERFTTYETAELLLPRIIKQSGVREPFNEAQKIERFLSRVTTAEEASRLEALRAAVETGGPERGMRDRTRALLRKALEAQGRGEEAAREWPGVLPEAKE